MCPPSKNPPPPSDDDQEIRRAKSSPLPSEPHAPSPKPPSSAPRLYIILRADLPAGLAAAQACHVARRFTKEHPELTCPDDENLVLLAAQNEEELRELDLLLAWEAPLTYRSWFHEPDLPGDEPCGQLTAIAVEGSQTPETALVLRKLLSELPLAFRWLERCTILTAAA